eukprot:Amastigsp_a348263_16.p3 type:complete len:139 gc:universal Amastigsp_a348263_16:341-757(+)
MQRPRGHVERAWVDHHHRARIGGNRCHLWESHVVADPKPDGAELGLRNRHLVACRERLRLAERDLARNVDVEEMQLPMGGHKLARAIENGCGVEELGRACAPLGNRAADEPDAGIAGGGRKLVRRGAGHWLRVGRKER